MSLKRSRHDENLEYRARMGMLSREAFADSAPNSREFGRKNIRHPGVSLKASDVPQLVETALASGGPIKQGEAFEHFLAVVCDNYRYHTFHFIIADALKAGGRRRAIMLSERTLHGSTDFGREREYAQRLAAYANALGSPRVMILLHSFNCDLSRQLKKLSPNMLFSSINLQELPACELLREKYRDNYALQVDHYKQGVITKDIKCPAMEALDDQLSAMTLGIDEKGRIAVTAKTCRMERELEALCLLGADEEDERLGFPRDTHYRQGTNRLP